MITFFILFIATCANCHASLECEEIENLPVFFQDHGKPISDQALIKILTGDVYDSEYFHWEYIGQLSNGSHVIWSHMESPGYQFWSIFILNEREGSLVVTDSIEGGKGCEVHAPELVWDTVFFGQTTSSGAFMAQAMDLFPEIKEVYDQSSQRGIGCSRSHYVGSSIFSALITEEGKIQDLEFISFLPAEGWPPYSGKNYFQEDLKNLALDFLEDIEEGRF